MKITYNSQIFQMQEYGGISRYFFNLTQRVALKEQVVVLSSLHINKYLSELPQSIVKGRRFPWRVTRGARILESIGSGLDRMAILGEPPDVLHETFYAYKSVGPHTIPTVVTVHDMIHERFSDWFPRKNNTALRKKAAIMRAGQVICISESTRRDLIDIYDVNPDKVSVVYHGHDVLIASDDALEQAAAFKMDSPYLLYVGDRAAYKNFKALLRAYASSTWLHENFRLVCFGGGSFRKDELELINALSIKPAQIKQLGGGDDVLSAYFQNAAAFVYPSLYEGFGMPPLEAMALGCPVICSNTSSIPEIVGDAGEYFDPEHDESIRVSVENVLQSAERRDELIRKGYKRCKEFSWDRCANETLEIYRKLAS